MPIHYDTIEDGQNQTSHRLFSKSMSETIKELAITLTHFENKAKQNIASSMLHISWSVLVLRITQA